MRTILASALLLLVCISLAAPSQAQVTTVLSGLNGPVDFAMLPDGSAWWLEYYTGDILRQDLATGQRTVEFHVQPIVDGERGLVGLGVDQGTADNGTFFVYYSLTGGTEGDINHLSRIDRGQETVLLTTTSSVRHNGGRIIILPDRSLFVSVGENDKGYPAQDPDSLLGKILHILPDGSAAPGNPHGRLYSLGHRNVYGLAYDPMLNRLFATENGNAERDEVNEILPGHNYGWPACEGSVKYDYKTKDDQRATKDPCTDPAFTAPLGEFTPTGTVAPTGAAILDGHLYWASWNQGSIHRLDQEADGTWNDTVVFHNGGRINDLEAGLDGHSLYYSNWTHILRLEMSAPADAPKLTPRAAADGATDGALATSTQTKAAHGSPGASLASVLAAMAAAGLLQARSRKRR
jgi:glucose/arabinose dehydrogenase